MSQRKLRFANLKELVAELDAIERANSDGHLKTTGNWTAGQILAHIAAWIEYGWDGYPMKAPAWPLRWVLILLGKWLRRHGMRSGVRIPGVKAGTYGQDDMPVQQALDRLRSAVKRLEAGELAKFHSPAFGAMSHADRIELNLRHAELHLGFLTY